MADNGEPAPLSTNSSKETEETQRLLTRKVKVPSPVVQLRLNTNNSSKVNEGGGNGRIHGSSNLPYGAQKPPSFEQRAARWSETQRTPVPISSFEQKNPKYFIRMDSSLDPSDPAGATVSPWSHQRSKVSGLTFFDFEEDDSEVAMLYELENHEEQIEDPTLDRAVRARKMTRAFLRWLILLLMGLSIELIFLFISFFSVKLTQLRLSVQVQEDRHLEKYLIKVSFSLLYVSLAFLAAYWVPCSAGSGLADTKVFLNGIRIPRMQSLTTLIAKMIGTIFSVSAGLPVGKYGPMIHIGTLVACVCSRTIRKVHSLDTVFEYLRLFSSPTERRNLAISGAAAGVTAAFGAPIGGLIFAWEEDSAVMTIKVAWRVTFCAMTTLLFAYLIAGSKSVLNGKIVNRLFVESYAGSFDPRVRVEEMDLLLVALMGILGGLIGATFNFCHSILSSLRSRFINTWGKRFAEVVFVTWLVHTVGFFASKRYGVCKPLPPDDPSMYPDGQDGQYIVPYVPSLIRMFCPVGQYNEMASLYFNDGVTSLRMLFHLPYLNPISHELMFSNQALMAFVLPYIIFILLTLGLHVPAGFFVPQLLAGAALGRALKQSLLKATPDLTHHHHVRLFAIMGSAAFTGGVQRMMLSLTVMMMEATGDLYFLLPFFIMLMLAQWVGNMFIPSLDDLTIKSKGYPYLRADPPKWARGLLRAGDVMTRRIVYLSPIETVGRIKEMLATNNHHLYPLLYPESTSRHGAVFGTITREKLMVLLESKKYSTTRDVIDDPDYPELISEIVDMPTIHKKAAQLKSRIIPAPVLTAPSIYDKLYIDLRPYSNPSLYYVTEDSSVLKAYRVFRGLGLQHLLVVDAEKNLVGIIGRRDLVTSALKDRYDDIKKGKRVSRRNFKLPEYEAVEVLRSTSTFVNFM